MLRRLQPENAGARTSAFIMIEVDIDGVRARMSHWP